MLTVPWLSLACALLASPAAAAAAPEEPPPCRMYLVPCNLAEAYCGTFQWEEHPDTDPVNGVTGTVRLRWSLSRSRP